MPKLQQIVQVAGARSAGEALMLARAGATHVGLPLRLPVHKPDVTEAEARGIVAALAAQDPREGRAQAVCITYLTDAAEALDLCRYLGVGGLQLHGDMPLEAVRRLRAAAPGLFLIKSLLLGTADEAGLLRLAQAHAPFVDAFLTDTFDPATGAAGATGRTHDWAVSARLARALPRPLIFGGRAQRRKRGARGAGGRPRRGRRAHRP